VRPVVDDDAGLHQRHVVQQRQDLGFLGRLVEDEDQFDVRPAKILCVVRQHGPQFSELLEIGNHNRE
jgi:hypothetical protein